MWTEIRQRFSSQTLAWDPSAIDTRAALGAYAMAAEFQEQLPDLPVLKDLNQMQSSHMILIPFLYRLMLKPLNDNHWSQIIGLWHKLWRLSEYPEQQPIEFKSSASSYEEALKKFLWISDLIVESTIPKLYEDSRLKLVRASPTRLRKKTEFKLHTPAAQIVKYLSDGRCQNTVSIMRYLLPTMKKIVSRMKTECIDLNRDLNSPTNQKQVLVSALDRLKDTAKLITAPITDIMAESQKIKEWSWTDMRELMIKGLITKDDNLKAETIMNKISSLPGWIQARIIAILHEARVNQAKPTPSLRAALRYGPLRGLLRGLPLEFLIKKFDEELSMPHELSIQHEETHLLPEQIHTFFDERMRFFAPSSNRPT
ncbi:hypothetical protein PSHT_15804 [Puccinia striiformis]|nr:hypothetical protein PSHT_15804 [Puccinia striiformis]